MGGERASKTRQRLAGKICYRCGGYIVDPPERPGERLCPRCEDADPQHRVLMNYMHRGHSWHISFLEADCRTCLPRKFTFANEDKILETARNGGAALTSEIRSMVAHGIEIGRGGVWLNLTDSQYQKLQTHH